MLKRISMMLMLVVVAGCSTLAPKTTTSDVAGRVAYLQYTEGYWQVWLMDAAGQNQRQLTRSPYDKATSSWYPDGEHLLIGGIQGELEKISIQDGKAQPLKLPLHGLVDAAVAPSGKAILFSLPAAGTTFNDHIWLINEDGTGQEKLTDQGYLKHQPVWAPQSDWIYFLSGKGDQSHDIWRLNYRTRELEQMTTGQLYHFDVAVSVSGMLAFSSNRSGNYEIWTWDGKAVPKQLTQDPGLDGKPSWSPEGDYLLFESSRGGALNIWRMSADGSQLQQLTFSEEGARSPSWFVGVSHD